MYNRLLFIIAISVFCSCDKEEKKEYPPEPVIEFQSITPDSVTEGQDKIIITFKYTDGDGDLGENRTDVKNLFVTDNRINVTYSFRVQELAPRGVAIPITGSLNTEISSVFITDSSQQQNVNYSLYIVDRAGHASNTITTSAVTIDAQ